MNIDRQGSQACMTNKHKPGTTNWYTPPTDTVKYCQNDPSSGHTILILCCLGQKTFQAGSVGRINNDTNSHVISGCHWCVAEA